MKIGYVKQTFKYPISQQVEILQAAKCTRIYTQPINNSSYKSDMIDNLKVGDTLVVTRFVVLSQSLQELLGLLNQLSDQRIDLISIEHQFTSSNYYKIKQILQIFSEFLEDIQYQRQQLGIIKAKAHGVHCGRPRKLTDKQLLKALDLKQYHTNLQVANKLGVSRSTLLRNIAEFREAG